MRSRDAEAMLVERLRMIRATHKRPDLRHPREVRSVETADGTAPNNANALHLSFPEIAAAIGNLPTTAKRRDARREPFLHSRHFPPSAANERANLRCCA